MLHLYRLTGNAFAFAGVQGSWNRHPSAPWTPLLAFLRKPGAIGEPWNLIARNFAAALLIAAAAAWFLAHRQWSPAPTPAVAAAAAAQLRLPAVDGPATPPSSSRSSS